MLESALEEMAALEGLEFRPRERVSNSNRALRLAEAWRNLRISSDEIQAMLSEKFHLFDLH